MIMKNKNLLTIFLIVLIDLLGFGIILPLLPYIAEKYQANPFQIGLLTASYSFFQLIASPILGRLSDRYGRKKILMISQFGSVVGYLLLGLAGSLLLLFISRIVDGITGGNISIAQAYIADVTDKKNRAKGMGMIGAAFGLGFIFGPALGGLLAKISYSTPAYFAAGIAMLTVVTTYFFLKESVDVKVVAKSPRAQLNLTELKRVLSIQPIGLLIVAFFLFNTAVSIQQGIFALWTQRTYKFGPTENGWLFAYIGIIVVIIQLRILPFIIKKFPEKTILRTAFVLTAIGLMSIPLLQRPEFLIYISLFILSFGNAFTNPVIQSIASENVPKEEYGGTLGFLQSAGSMGRIVGPALGDELFFRFGKDTPFIIAAMIMFLLAGYIWKKI